MAAINYGIHGRLGAAPEFNPNNDTPSLQVEGSGNDDESGSLFMNGNTICLWSPGDNRAYA